MTLLREAQNGPLCPNSFPPLHPSHALRVRMLDAFYEAMERDDQGESTSELETAYSAAAYERVSDRMDLFTHSEVFFNGRSQIEVESWWYRCRVCGLVLPAQGVVQFSR